MDDQRTSTALRQLADLGSEPDQSRWQWRIVRVEDSGRLVMPSEARGALGAGTLVRGICNRITLVLRADGAGAAMAVDRRGRLYLPAWLRPAATRTGSVLVGTRHAAGLVVVAPTGLLDHLGDTISGGSR